jgi:hypothetical protein
MDKALAGEILKYANELGAICNNMDPSIRQLTSDDERTIFLRRLGKIMADINVEFILPIIRAHPELAPDLSA